MLSAFSFHLLVYGWTISIMRQRNREAGHMLRKKKSQILNADLQRIARREKKAILSDQCKEIEQNNRMRKTKDLIKKNKDCEGTFMQRWAQ